MTPQSNPPQFTQGDVVQLDPSQRVWPGCFMFVTGIIGKKVMGYVTEKGGAKWYLQVKPELCTYVGRAVWSLSGHRL